MSNKKICDIIIITDTYVGTPGGSERHLQNFLSCIDNEKFNVLCVQMTPDNSAKLPEGKMSGSPSVNLLLKPIRSVRSMALLKLYLFLISHIKKNKTDLVVSYHEKSDILNYLLSLFPGLDLVHVSSKRDLGFKQNHKLKKLMDFINPRIGTITAPSKSILEQMTDNYGSNIKTYLIPNGTDLIANKPVSQEVKEDTRRKLSLPVNKYLIGIVGSLSEVKGHRYLLNAFSDFSKSSNNEWFLVIVGSGALESSMHALVKELGIEDQVYFAGYQKEIYNWLVSLDIVVSSSTSEGLSNALIEAAACGLPIIATDVGGNPEIVKNDYNGMLVKAADPVSLCEALMKFDNDIKQLKTMGANSRAIAEECFSISSMVNKLESLYLKLSDEK